MSKDAMVINGKWHFQCGFCERFSEVMIPMRFFVRGVDPWDTLEELCPACFRSKVLRMDEVNDDPFMDPVTMTTTMVDFTDPREIEKAKISGVHRKE